VLANGERCSSTRIRAALAEGDVVSAATLLGKPYSITGYVRAGDKRGRTIGFPTTNILPVGIFTPALGVYAVRVTCGDEHIRGVANLGVRPTFGGQRVQLEIHLFDWKKDIYGERIKVDFVERIRAEQKFDGIDALKQQIAKDCDKAKSILGS